MVTHINLPTIISDDDNVNDKDDADDDDDDNDFDDFDDFDDDDDDDGDDVNNGDDDDDDDDDDEEEVDVDGTASAGSFRRFLRQLHRFLSVKNVRRSPAARAKAQKGTANKTFALTLCAFRNEERRREERRAVRRASSAGARVVFTFARATRREPAKSRYRSSFAESTI